MNIFFSLGNQENADYDTVKKLFHIKKYYNFNMLVFNLVINKST